MLTGEQFGRYLIRDKIGEGGMGEVYSATDVELDRSADYLAAQFKALGCQPVNGTYFHEYTLQLLDIAQPTSLIIETTKDAGRRTHAGL